MRKPLVLVAFLAVGLAVVAGLVAPSAQPRPQSRNLIVGHLRRAGDARRPDLGVRPVQAARRRGAPGQPLLGRPERRRAQEAPDERAQPERPRLRLVGLRRDGQAVGRQQDQARLLDPLDAVVGRPGEEHGAAPDDRPPQLRLRGREALQRQLPSDPRRAGPAGRTALDGLERAEQPGLPEAPVHEDQPAQVQARQPADLRRDVQRDHVRRPPDGARRREGRLRRDRTARKQHRDAAAGVGLTAHLPARPQAGPRALRRLRAPPVLPASERVAAQAAARARARSRSGTSTSCSASSRGSTATSTSGSPSTATRRIRPIAASASPGRNRPRTCRRRTGSRARTRGST